MGKRGRVPAERWGRCRQAVICDREDSVPWEPAGLLCLRRGQGFQEEFRALHGANGGRRLVENFFG